MALPLADPTDNKIVWCKFMTPKHFSHSFWCSQHIFYSDSHWQVGLITCAWTTPSALYAPEADRYVRSSCDVSLTPLGIQFCVVCAHVWAVTRFLDVCQHKSTKWELQGIMAFTCKSLTQRTFRHAGYQIFVKYMPSMCCKHRLMSTYMHSNCIHLVTWGPASFQDVDIAKVGCAGFKDKAVVVLLEACSRPIFII
jgi:hypothetical protein